MNKSFWLKTTINDQEINYLQFGNTNNPIIVCLHGYADTAEVFTDLGEKLADKYCVIAPNLPIDNQVKKIHSLNSLENFLSEFVKKICPQEITLLGFSMGGLIAVEHAKKNHLVKKLILNNCPLKYFINKREEFLYNLLKPALISRTFCFLFSLIKTNSFLKDRLGSIKDEITLNLMKKYPCQVFGTEFNLLNLDLSSDYKKLEIQKAVLFFKDDEVIKFSRYKNSFEGLGGKVLLVENGGHNSKAGYWENVLKTLFSANLL